MHSMVGSFAPYTRKQHQSSLVRGYFCRFIQCSFPCGVTMLILSLLLMIFGSTLLIYIFRYNGCDVNITSSMIKCNRQAMKVLGITFLVSAAVLLLISLVVMKYSRSSEENNIIRAPKSSLRASKQQQYSHPTSSTEHEQQNAMIVSSR